MAARCNRRLDDALRYSRRAVELAPDQPSYIDTLGEVHFRRRDFDEAVRCAERCLELDPDNKQAEFAIIVRSDQKGRGLGRILLEKMVRYCRGHGTGEIMGQVLSQNAAMLSLARKLGFESKATREAGVREVRLHLND